MRQVVGGILFASVMSFALGANTQSGEPDAKPMLGFGFPCKNPLTAESRSEKQPITPPRYRKESPPARPTYPPFAERSGQEGTVYLDLYVTDEGRVGEVRLNKSSGWPLLDNAAMEGTRNWTLHPAETNKRPVCMWVTAPVVFKLEDYSQVALRTAKVTPEAEEIAKHVLGETSIERMLLDYSLNADDQDAEAIRLLFTSLIAQPQWREGAREVAAMLSIEMRPDQLAELNRYFATPVMQEFFRLAPRFSRTLQRNQGRMALISACVAESIGDAARKNVAIKEPEERMQAALLQRVPRFVEVFTPYCACAANSKLDNLPAEPKCGARPKLDW